MFHTKFIEKLEKNVIFNNFFFENRAVCEIMWKNIAERGRPHLKIWRMRIAYWIPKATNTHTRVVQYALLFHCNNGCTHAPRCCILRTLPIVLEYEGTGVNQNIRNERAAKRNMYIPGANNMTKVNTHTYVYHKWE